MSQRDDNIREEIEPWLSELIRLYGCTNPAGGTATEEGKLENARRAIDLWWYLNAKLMLWAQSHVMGKAFLESAPDQARRIARAFSTTTITPDSHLLEYVGLQFAWNPVDDDDPVLASMEKLLEGADYISPEALRNGIDELLMSKSADSSFWRFELQAALRHLSLGYVEDLVKPAPTKRQGNRVDVMRWRMMALKHVYYLKGKGVKKYRALNQVGAGIGQSSETLRTWEKEFLKDEDCAYELWFSEVAGQYETELDGSRSYVILDEFGLEPYYRNTSLSTYARSVLTAIRKYALSDVQEKLRESRLGSGE
jgi:hypothetical protein